jgi:hypothetical protein
VAYDFRLAIGLRPLDGHILNMIADKRKAR